MKKKIQLSIATVLVLLVVYHFSSCKEKTGSNTSLSQSYTPTPELAAVTVVEKVKFDGSFAGSTNQTKYRLDISNQQGTVKGTMKDGENSFLLEGIVINEKVTGILKYVLGDMPFEAYYQGPSLIIQLDKESMNALKLLIAIGSDDANVLLADDKIVFDEN